DFNPIENYWAVMKKQIRKVRHFFNNIDEAIDSVLKTKRTTSILDSLYHNILSIWAEITLTGKYDNHEAIDLFPPSLN
ncbi:MAG: hypothetical protein Q9M20_06565, partial [Mariprofundaceae bacterium]|nr:hypothetical protein [Mariprofundaceae bacterium]